MAHSSPQCRRLLDDKTGAEDILARCSNKLFAQDPDNLGVIISEVGIAQPWRRQFFRTEVELEKYICQTPASRNSSRIILLPSSTSRTCLNITRKGFQSLTSSLNAFSAITKMVEAFIPDRTDFYLGRGCAHFALGDPSETSSSQLLELSCLLKFVERNTRDSGIEGWSVRQMGIYHSYSTQSNSESTVVVNPSDKVWSLIKEHLSTTSDPVKSWQSWTFMPLLFAKSLCTGWSDYIRDLNREVFDMMLNAAFLDVSDKENGEQGKTKVKAVSVAEIKSMNLMRDKLMLVLHALRNNRETLLAFMDEAKRRHEIIPHDSEEEYETLRSGMEDVLRELQFAYHQVEFIMFRLEQTTHSYRDVAQWEDSHNMQQMTVKSIKEAHAVRIIALVTFLFLPPTFTCGFFEMDFVHVSSFKDGVITMSADAGLLFWLAITLPLMALTVTGWFLWDSRIRRNQDVIASKRKEFSMV